jgi:hypothetical protein
MRFKGTWMLLVVCLAIGCFIYFYEIKGGEQREKAKENESRFWMLESKDIQQIEFSPPDEKIVAVRKTQEEWAIQVPRPLEADSGELNRLAESAAGIKFESILEENVSDPAPFGLDPAPSGLKIKTGDGKEYGILFGNKNPTGNRMYARVMDNKKIYLVASTLSETFNKKLEDLRNHSVLQFEQSEAQSLNIKNEKGDIRLTKDSDDRWWIEGAERIAADSPGIRGILNALSLGRIPEFFDEDPDNYVNFGIEKPRIDVSLTYGKDKAIKRLKIGTTKVGLRKKGADRKLADMDVASASSLYLAEDSSRPEFFFVDKDLVDKLDKSLYDLRDKALAAFQRWDVDSIILENPNGRFTFNKSGGEWFFGDEKKKADFDAVNGILDALESDSLELIDKPAGLAAYGLDKPAVHVILKQEARILADCSLGKITEKGVYAQLKGDPSVKIADLEKYGKLTKNDKDFIETAKPNESDATNPAD